MSKSRSKKRGTKPGTEAESDGRLPRVAVIVLLLAVVAALGFWWHGRQPASAPPLMPPATAADATNRAADSATANPGFAKLKGKWLRPDGGYVIEVRGVDADGKMDATYANPAPIHVARAEATQEGPATKVFVELRDVNYPGSTYDLVYDHGSDQLTGIYYQAVVKQRFEVVFVRMK